MHSLGPAIVFWWKLACICSTKHTVPCYGVIWPTYWRDWMCFDIHKSDACKVISDGHRLSDEYYRRIISIHHQFLYPTPASGGSIAVNERWPNEWDRVLLPPRSRHHVVMLVVRLLASITDVYIRGGNLQNGFVLLKSWTSLPYTRARDEPAEQNLYEHFTNSIAME